MSRASIPVDLFNPGQVFACLGFAEAAKELLGDSRAAFDWSDDSRVVFWLEAPSDGSPFVEALRFLSKAAVTSLSSADGPDTSRWKVDTDFAEEEVFPVAPPPSPATLPALLRGGGHKLRFDHWGDTTKRDNVKFWAGAGGYPGAGLLRDAIDLARENLGDAAEDPFALSAVQSSSFRLDWRRDYVPLDAGFSLNEHASIKTRGYPLVEIFGALGLAYARPTRPDPKDKLRYYYGAIASTDNNLLPLALLRASLGGSRELPFPQRTFIMNLDWPGQEGQARCITTVSEETNHD